VNTVLPIDFPTSRLDNLDERHILNELTAVQQKAKQNNGPKKGTLDLVTKFSHAPD
jgi:hypothetical protein